MIDVTFKPLINSYTIQHLRVERTMTLQEFRKQLEGLDPQCLLKEGCDLYDAQRGKLFKAFQNNDKTLGELGIDCGTRLESRMPNGVYEKTGWAKLLQLLRT